jgi:hypothetical protein
MRSWRIIQNEREGKHCANHFNCWLWRVSPCFSPPFPRARAANGPQHASDFTSTEYYEPPHQQQIKSILSGAEALPQPGGLLIIKQLKLETFNLDGKLEVTIMAPECIYDTFKGVANSPGHLQVRTGDGKIPHRGRRFFVAAKRFKNSPSQIMSAP